MEPKIYLSGNGGANTIYPDADFDTSTMWGETLHSNLQVLSWEQYESLPVSRQMGLAFQLLDRMDNADLDSPPNPYQIEAIKICREARAIEGSTYFNGHNYPVAFRENVIGWLKRFLSHCQAD